MRIRDRIRTFLERPRSALAMLGLVAAVVVVTLVLAGGFTSFVQYSNTMEFCISCHEMESTVYQEYRESAHWTTRSGVRPKCADCHVPHDNWITMVVYKAGATKELFLKATGAVNTPEKFEAARLGMAESVWAQMKSGDSATCRFCHKTDAWDLDLQKPRARAQHTDMVTSGETCIDCHKGIAHKAVHAKVEDKEESFDPFGGE